MENVTMYTLTLTRRIRVISHIFFVVILNLQKNILTFLYLTEETVI